MITDARVIDGLDKRLAPFVLEFLNWLSGQGLQIIVTSGRRSSLKQRQLYERYLRGESGGLPALPPGRSLHEHGLAWDMVFQNVPRPRTPRDPGAALYEAVGRMWESLGGEWGGRAPIGYDPVHFQFKRLSR